MLKNKYNEKIKKKKNFDLKLLNKFKQAQLSPIIKNACLNLLLKIILLTIQ